MTATAMGIHKCSLGDLIVAAYESASRATQDQRQIPVVARQRLKRWLAKSSRRDLLR